jgi:hypothetical protein
MEQRNVHLKIFKHAQKQTLGVPLYVQAQAGFMSSFGFLEFAGKGESDVRRTPIIERPFEMGVPQGIVQALVVFANCFALARFEGIRECKAYEYRLIKTDSGGNRADVQPIS